MLKKGKVVYMAESIDEPKLNRKQQRDALPNEPVCIVGNF